MTTHGCTITKLTRRTWVAREGQREVARGVTRSEVVAQVERRAQRYAVRRYELVTRGGDVECRTGSLDEARSVQDATRWTRLRIKDTATGKFVA